MRKLIERLYAAMDKGPLRVLSFCLALLLAGCVFWDPSRFAAKTGPLAIWQGIVIMWAVCTGVIHGVGFRPLRLRWQAFFSPLPAQIILLVGLGFFFS
ncbi:cytochrome bd biosynthesis protein [[Pantoea] beijingensis]|uniref:Cytochrome bd biosynthesis protein n=1 Tax=[Pantoea] beijingensis TaxID=1324864 RepID=A0A443IAF2_9GAMM|nr:MULTISPECIES: cyd operon protein YbgE [Erwiniaceae]RWR01148.1 cytochrome bd biosynthesis protein [[Pantoea] beijingensis]